MGKTIQFGRGTNYTAPADAQGMDPEMVGMNRATPLTHEEQNFVRDHRVRGLKGDPMLSVARTRKANGQPPPRGI